MIAFASAIGSGALPRLEHLFLDENQIGDSGMQSFAAAVGSGALPQLKEFLLDNNQIGDAGVQALSAALVSGAGALPRLEILFLNRNQPSRR